MAKLKYLVEKTTYCNLQITYFKMIHNLFTFREWCFSDSRKWSKFRQFRWILLTKSWSRSNSQICMKNLNLLLYSLSIDVEFNHVTWLYNRPQMNGGGAPGTSSVALLKFVDLHQMLHLVTDGFFDMWNVRWDIEQHICTVFTYITALFSVKVWL